MALPPEGKFIWNGRMNNKQQSGRMGWGLVRYKSEKQNYDVQAITMLIMSVLVMEVVYGLELQT